MLRSRHLQEHPALVRLVLHVVHQDQPLGFLSLLARFPLGLNLLRVQKVALFRLLLWVDEADGHLLLQEPLIGSFKVILLVALVFRVDNLTKHLLEAVEELLHVAEVDAKSRLELLLLGRGTFLTVALLLNVEFD